MRFKNYVLEVEYIDEAIKLPSGKDFLKSIQLTAALLGANYMAGDPFGNKIRNVVSKNHSEINSNDIITSFKGIPKDLVRLSQFDKTKWDQDFIKLKKPSGEDLGFATHKELFDVPATIHVVKHSAMIGENPSQFIRIAFANPYTLEIFLSEKLFEKLPSAGNMGKLSQFGLNNLAHELRHLTQKMNVTDPRTKDRNEKTTDHKQFYNYLNDPVELGVRLAATKNLMSKPTLQNIAQTLTVNRSNIDLAMKSLPHDEKEMLVMVLNPRKWAKAMVQERKKMGIDDVLLEDHYFFFVKMIVSKLAEMNTDVSQLINHYQNVPNRKKFLDELLQNYDQVVNAYNAKQYRLA